MKTYEQHTKNTTKIAGIPQQWYHRVQGALSPQAPWSHWALGGRPGRGKDGHRGGLGAAGGDQGCAGGSEGEGLGEEDVGDGGLDFIHQQEQDITTDITG